MVKDILISYLHDCYSALCPSSGTFVFRTVQTEDTGFEEPQMRCIHTNGILKPFSMNGKQIDNRI